MARKKKTEEILNESEQTVEATEVANSGETQESQEKTAFRNLIEAYKIQNPAKYEVKKEELLAQLNSLK